MPKEYGARWMLVTWTILINRVLVPGALGQWCALCPQPFAGTVFVRGTIEMAVTSSCWRHQVGVRVRRDQSHRSCVHRSLRLRDPFSHAGTTTNTMCYRPPKECQYYEHTWHAPELTRRLLVRTQPLSAHEFELTSTSCLRKLRAGGCGDSRERMAIEQSTPL